MNAETMMKEYKQMKLELQVTEMQVQRFTGVSDDDVISMMTYHHPSYDEERVQTSGTSDKTFKVACNYKKIMARQNEDWYNFLLKRYVKLKEEIEFFEDCMKSLPDDLLGVVRDLIGKELTWNEIADKHDISRRSVTNYRNRAIDELNHMYEFRDSCVEEYMLS